MIIIVEGPDGAGKSTLAKRIQQQSGNTLLKMSYPRSQEEKDSMVEDYMYILENHDNLIFDRCWYSDMVYAPRMRNESSPVDTDSMLMLEDAVARKGGLIIHCDDDIDSLWQRCTTRGEDYVTDKETLGHIKLDYMWLLQVLTHRIPVVNYTVPKRATYLHQL